MKSIIAIAVLATGLAASGASAQDYYGRYGPGYRGPSSLGPTYRAYQRHIPRSLYRYRGQRATRDSGPGLESTVEGRIQKLREFVSARKSEDAIATAKFIETEIVPFVDFDHMAGWAAGPRWKDLGEQARASLASRISEHFTETLSRGMRRYSDARFKVGKARSDRNRQGRVVPVYVSSRRGRPLSLEFHFHRKDDGWKVYDVRTGGQSALMFYRGYLQRSQFQEAAEKANKGAIRATPPRYPGMR